MPIIIHLSILTEVINIDIAIQWNIMQEMKMMVMKVIITLENMTDKILIKNGSI